MGKSLRKYKEGLSERFSAINLICKKLLSNKDKKPISKLNYGEDIERLNTLVSGDNPTDAYKAQEEKIIKGLTGALTSKFNMKALAAEWPEMPENEKRSLLKRILKVQASLQSTHDIRVKAARLEIKPIKCSGSMAYNIEDRVGKRDRITISDKIFNKSLSDTLNTLTHEQTHILQATLARAVSFKQIHTSNPLYRDGLYFLLKDSYDGYVCSEIDEPYMRQRDEVDAYMVGDTIGEFAAKFEPKAKPEEKAKPSSSKKAPQPAVPA